MQSYPFGNFQAGMIDDPLDETGGGFEFASGMDIFSEPGVLKAAYAMTEVGYSDGTAQPTALPLWLVETTDGSGNGVLYIAAGAKILQSIAGGNLTLMLTNSKGTNKGLAVWNNYIMYAADGYVGRMQVEGGLLTNVDDYHTYSSPVLTDYYPMTIQGGTLKIGAGRYITSVDESFTFSDQALKLPQSYYIQSMVSHFNNVFVGTKNQSTAGAAFVSGASAFSWDGTVLSSGSALPNAVYPKQFRGMPGLFSDSRYLYAFPDREGDILVFDGAGFVTFRKLRYIANNGYLLVNPGAITQYLDTILFAGNSTIVPGVFQMQGTAICQSFVPAGATPGVDSFINIGFVKTALDGVVYIGYYKDSDTSYHIEKTTSNRQNNAVVKTVWHRARVGRRPPLDHLKRWIGVKLNLKPMAAGCSVKVEYRTDPNASFTDSGVTINSTNQEKPVIFAAQPRSRRIQYRFTYTTSGSNTPEMLSYNPLFEVLSTIRS